jgi:hypothetical protein
LFSFLLLVDIYIYVRCFRFSFVRVR